MKVKLVNSAMMPNPGVYYTYQIPEHLFGELLQRASREGMLVSYIGYEQNVAFLYKHFGVTVPVNRSQCALDDGDILLIMRLPYRVAHPGEKGQPVPEVFEYLLARYFAPSVQHLPDPGDALRTVTNTVS